MGVSFYFVVVAGGRFILWLWLLDVPLSLLSHLSSHALILCPNGSQYTSFKTILRLFTHGVADHLFR